MDRCEGKTSPDETVRPHQSSSQPAHHLQRVKRSRKLPFSVALCSPCLQTAKYKHDSLGLHQINLPQSFSPALTSSGAGIDWIGSNPWLSKKYWRSVRRLFYKDIHPARSLPYLLWLKDTVQICIIDIFRITGRWHLLFICNMVIQISVSVCWTQITFTII